MQHVSQSSTNSNSHSNTNQSINSSPQKSQQNENQGHYSTPKKQTQPQPKTSQPPEGFCDFFWKKQRCVPPKDTKCSKFHAFPQQPNPPTTIVPRGLCQNAWAGNCMIPACPSHSHAYWEIWNPQGNNDKKQSNNQSSQQTNMNANINTNTNINNTNTNTKNTNTNATAQNSNLNNNSNNNNNNNPSTPQKISSNFYKRWIGDPFENSHRMRQFVQSLLVAIEEPNSMVMSDLEKPEAIKRISEIITSKEIRLDAGNHPKHTSFQRTCIPFLKFVQLCESVGLETKLRRLESQFESEDFFHSLSACCQQLAADPSKLVDSKAANEENNWIPQTISDVTDCITSLLFFFKHKYNRLSNQMQTEFQLLLDSVEFLHQIGNSLSKTSNDLKLRDLNRKIEEKLRHLGQSVVVSNSFVVDPNQKQEVMLF